MRRAPAGPSREGGFTLVEVMLALTISAIVIAGMYQSFNFLHKWWISAGLQSDQRQNARAGLETLTRDLEMAGYQTTSYGDVNKTGLAITLASAHEIEVDQQRPHDDNSIALANPPYEPRLVYYHLATDVKTGRQNLYRQIRTQPGLPSPDEIVAENVTAFNLAYFDSGDDPVTGLPPASPSGFAAYTPGTAAPAALRDIRRIDVTLTTKTARPLTFGPGGKDYTLTASVTPQNLFSADEVTADTTPPVMPAAWPPPATSPPRTVPEVYDTRSCTGKLRVRFPANTTDPDLAGYVVFYGTTDKVLVPLNALADRSNPEITLNPENLLITKFADSGRPGSTANTPNTYALQLVAYDSGGNYSGKTTPAVSGNPATDVTAFGGANDTTVNPLKPTPPNTDAAGVRTPLTVTAGANAGELVVSWQAPADGSATAGYRLYRSTVPFVNGNIANALQIAMENALTPDLTTWTDKNLDTCRTYYYAVASVHCDETLVAAYLHDSGSPSLSDYAVGSGATVDTVKPPPPGFAGSVPDLASSLDVPRVFLTLTNPLESVCPDFDRTEVFWSKAPAAAPHLNGTTGAVDPDDHIPDLEPSGSAGVFRKRGSQGIVFDSETLADPSSAPYLTAGATYNLLAVSYDRCGNFSSPVAQSLDIPAPPTCAATAGSPPLSTIFSNPRFTSCQPDAVEIGWDYPGETVPGFEGFRIWRDADQLTAAPTTLTTWTDAGTLVDGGEYRYSVRATDCLYESTDPALHSPTNISFPPYYIPSSAAFIYPGRLQRYVPLSGSSHALDAENFVTTVSDASAPYTYHNNVKFFLQNTSRGPMTLKKMAVAWNNPNVVLDQVVIGGSPSATTQQSVSAGGAISGAAFTVNAVISDVASGVGSPSGAVPVRLRFATPSGGANRLADMRSDTLGISLWDRSNSLQDRDCAAAARIVVEVPRGPLIGGFSQSAPGLFGIDSYEVMGVSNTARDTDVKVPFGIDVNIFGTAFDNSRDLFADGINRGFSVLKVVGISTAAADPAAIPAMPTTGSSFERPLWSIGGNRYAISRTSPSVDGALMPQVSDQANWYYGLAVDATGNWDRAPDPDVGNYAYYQPPFDVCAVTPMPPVLTLASTSAGQARLTWTAPTVYEDGFPIVGTDALTYDVYVKSAGGDPWPSTPFAANLTGTSATHTANLLTATYYYMVRAKNSCATPRVSAASNVVMECEGPTAADCSLFSVPTTARYNDPIALAMSGLCAYRDNGLHDDGEVVFRVQSGGVTTNFATPETYDEGAFFKTITAVWSGGGGDNVLATSGTLSVDLVVGGATPCAARTVTITGGECFTTPNPPTSFSAVRGSAGSAAANLAWIRPNFNSDGSPLSDLAGYQIDMARCAAFNAGSGNCDIWSAWTEFQLNDPTAQSYSWTGLVINERYKFRLRAKDNCATPNFSAFTAESATVRVR